VREKRSTKELTAFRLTANCRRLLRLEHNQLTSVKGLEKLTQLTDLYLGRNPDLTVAQIAALQKALPKCQINSNAKK
tara:strand:+ start:742 stop:972 length:231 start_codon:yes stop_codon:yes gene_type:complete